MNTGDFEQLAARAELYLCLARAFMAPHDPALAAALRDALAPDLRELDQRLGLQAQDSVADFEREVGRGGPLELLQAYAALFVAPPACASINVGRYMDGAINGGSVREMEQAYLACGLAPDGGFHDLADHLGVLLEFVGVLFARLADGQPVATDPGVFLYRFLAPCADKFASEVAAAGDVKELSCNPWRGLAAVLAAAVRQDAVEPEFDPVARRRERAIQRARAMYAARDVSLEDLEEIRERLRARGLSADHIPSSPEEARQRVAVALGRP